MQLRYRKPLFYHDDPSSSFFYEFYEESHFNPLNPLTRSFLILYIIKYKNNSIYSKETKETPRTTKSGLKSGLSGLDYTHPSSPSSSSTFTKHPNPKDSLHLLISNSQPFKRKSPIAFDFFIPGISKLANLQPNCKLLHS